MRTYEVYIQDHDNGDYYIGQHVENGKTYNGSGKHFSVSYKHNPDKWSKIVVASGLTQEQARWLERAMVGQDVVLDPHSYNLVKGGNVDTSTAWTDKGRQKVYSMGKENVKFLHTDEVKMKAKEGWAKSDKMIWKNQSGSKNPMFNKKPWNAGMSGDYGWTLSEDQRKNHSNLRSGKKKMVEINNTTFFTITAASEMTGISPYLIRKGINNGEFKVITGGNDEQK